MEIRVTARPHLLLETVELMFAYVNEVPPQKLVRGGDYCLTVEAAQEIMEVACAGISRDDPAMQYYFGRYVLSREPERVTCIARNLAYNIMNISEGNISAAFEYLRDYRRRQIAQNFRIAAIGENGLTSVEPENDHMTSMEADIARLNVSPEYARKLLEQFSAYDEALARLEALVAPVAEKLASLLAPWEEQAEPLARAWSEHLQQPGAVRTFLKRLGYKKDAVATVIDVQLRYLQPVNSNGNGNGSTNGEGRFFLHVGVGVPIEHAKTDGIAHWEVEALRLLGSVNRLRILQVLLDRPMSARELAKELDLNLGSVFRDVTSLHEVRLIFMEAKDGRRLYRTDGDVLRIIAGHIAELNRHQLLC